MSEKNSNLRVGFSRKSFSCSIRRRLKKDGLATDSIRGMKESEESKMKAKLWMVKERASEKF